MIGLDTNVLVRYVTQDDAEQARLAGRLLEHTLNPRNPGFVANIVLCELVWVLESGYGYAREPVALSPAARARLRAFDGPLLLPLSSGEALQTVLAAAPDDIAARLRGACVLAASGRLAALARDAGCADVRIAAGPRPAQLLAGADAGAVMTAQSR